ncbi:MAG: YdiY family protein [Elusimicrobiota bacterium]
MRKLFNLSLVLGLVAINAVSSFSEEVKKPWSNQSELSVVSANGNTKSTTGSAKNTYKYNWSKTTLELIAGALGSNSKGTTTAEQYFASEKLSYKLSDRNYAFQKNAWDKNRFAGIKNRYDMGAGLGRELVKTSAHHLIGELGGGFISEERTVGPKNDFAVGRGYSKYVWTFSPTANISQDAEYLHNFEDSEDFRVNTESALTAALTKNFSLKVSYKWKHVGVPPIGFSRNDTITTVALLVTY